MPIWWFQPCKVSFSFKIKLDRSSLTKRTISSIYDPLGFAALFVLEGRRILQSLCTQNLPCDMEVNDDVKKECNTFITRLKHVNELYVRRCIRPDDFWKISDINIHHFSDPSEQGYGQCSYIRMVDEEGRIHCSLLLEKISPKKVCLKSKVRADCSCFISKKVMFVEERTESWRSYPLFLERL